VKFIKYALLSILIISVVVIPFLTKRTTSSRNPYTYYRVYYDGELLGTIKSEEELLNYIDESNKKYKEEYGVNKIYKPNDLFIKSYKTFENSIDDTESVYNAVKSLADVTVKGFKFTITGEEKEDTVYVIDENVFSEAIEKVIETFVEKEDYENYKNGNPVQTNNMIENIYLKEDISYKEVYIPVSEKIYTDSLSLAAHFLYGEESKSKEYTVKVGDTIETVAFQNEINTGEFLLSNPIYTDAENMLAVGTNVVINPLMPTINVVVETHEVNEEVKHFTVETTYDDQKNQNYFKVLRQGEDGFERITRRVETINGVNTYVLTLSKEELKPSISEIDVKGSKIVSKVGGSTWAWPTESGYYISDRYRWRYSPIYGTRELHTGLDITGTGCYSKLYAANNGEVIMANYVDNNSYGLYVVINHNNGYSTLYAHMVQVNVKKGDIVEKGQVIGLMGTTGDSTGCHLHFELWSGYPWVNGYRLNPAVLPAYNR